MNKFIETAEILEVPEADARLNSPLPKVQLPGDGRLLSAFAVDCAEVLKDCGIYQRGGVAFIVNQQRDGLDVITAPMLRTLAEQHLVCYRVRGSGDKVVSLPRTDEHRGRARCVVGAAIPLAFAQGRQNCDGASPRDAGQWSYRTASGGL